MRRIAVRLPAIVLLSITLLTSCAGLREASAECITSAERFDAYDTAGAEPIPPDELREVVDTLVECVNDEEIARQALDAAVLSFTLRDMDISSDAQSCLRPLVETDPTAFLIAHHDRVHGLAMQPETRATWAQAMASCVPLSFVMSDRAPGGVDRDEAACLDNAADPPETLLPYFLNIALNDDRVPYSEWPESDLDIVFDPMYECVDIVARAYDSEVLQILGDTTEECIQAVFQRHHIFSRAELPPEAQSAALDETDRCIPAEELAALEQLAG